MKKNKTQLKKENRNLRRNKERILRMNLYRGKEVSVPLSHIRTDRMGNITRLINKKGSVLPTETKMYGCDIEKSVPQYVRRFVDKMGLGEMIRVPIRTKGLTGSGMRKECHCNVVGIVKIFEGQILRGYSVSMFKNGHVSLLYHSVWITPEGKCVDITNNYNDHDFREQQTEDSIIRKGDKEYILFLPFGLGLIDELGFEVNQMLFKQNWEISGFQSKREGDHPFKSYIVEINGLDEFLSRKGCLEQVGRKKSLIDVKQSVYESHFYQKSLGSGKSWDELKRETVWN